VLREQFDGVVEPPPLLLPPPHDIEPLLCGVARPLRPRLAGTTTVVINVICSPQGVQRFAATENNDKMMMELLMKDEVDAAAEDEQRLMILYALLRPREQLYVVPRRGGSRIGKTKNKDLHWLAGAMLLEYVDCVQHQEYEDYFICKKYCTRL
jgi:hypothetical protein